MSRADPIDTRHAPLQARKTLAAKFRLYRILHEGEGSGADEQTSGSLLQEETCIDRIEKSALRFIEQSEMNSSEIRRLDDDLRSCARRVRDSLAAEFGDDEEGTAVAKRWSGRIAGLDCRKCASAVGHVCDGTDRDNMTVVAGGHCILELAEIETWARERCRLLLEELLLPSMAGFTKIVTTWGTSALTTGEQSVAGTTGHAQVAAYTSYPGSSASHITIKIHARHFKWKDMCTLPYLFFHEHLCHAYQDSEGTRHPRVPVGRSCHWTEGWMDAIAYWLVSESIEQRMPTKKSPENHVCHWMFNDGSVDRIRDAINEIHASRHDEASSLPRDLLRRRREARAAARSLWKIFGIFDPTDEATCLLRAARFSFGVNQADLSQRFRHNLVRAILRLGRPEKVNTGRCADLVTALLAFEESLDPGLLLSVVPN